MFEQSFKIFQKRRKHDSTEKTMKINDLAPPKLTFSNQNSVRFSSFFQHLFPDLIFPTFDAPWCQNARFWHPLGTRKCPKWRPKSPKRRQSCFRKLPGELLLAELLSRLISDRSWLDFDGFLMDFGWIWMKSGLIFLGLWLLFCSSICRVPRPRWHETNKRKTSRTCRYMQKHSKNNAN